MSLSMSARPPLTSRKEVAHMLHKSLDEHSGVSYPPNCASRHYGCMGRGFALLHDKSTTGLSPKILSFSREII